MLDLQRRENERGREGRAPHNIGAGKTAATVASVQSCSTCGSGQHFGRVCKLVTSTGFNMDALAESIGSAPDPESALQRTLFQEWPRSTLFRAASVKTRLGRM